jgi:hypothetical protein
MMNVKCSLHGRNDKCMKILIGKREGKRPPGKTRRRRIALKCSLGRPGLKIWTRFICVGKRTGGELQLQLIFEFNTGFLTICATMNF